MISKNLTQSTEVLYSEPTIAPWKIKLLYDGLCPLCMREVNFLQKRDAGRGIVAFVDIADLDYDPAEHGGVEFAEAMGRIHAVLPDGTVIRDVAVFRRVYEELGMGLDLCRNEVACRRSDRPPAVYPLGKTAA
jgi:predicted DCC family thiol-disulfide oxidoreductase YuxK